MTNKIDYEKIVLTVNACAGCDLRSPWRTAKVVNARDVATALMWDAGMSGNAIAGAIGRDRTTVVASQHRITAMRAFPKQFPEFHELFSRSRAALNTNAYVLH